MRSGLVGLFLTLAVLVSREPCAAQNAGGAPEAAAPATGSKQEEHSKALEQVALLAHDQFNIRQEAYRKLKEMGRAALEPLREALEAPDAEVRTRAFELLIFLRGRGFLGIQPTEDWSSAEPADGTVDDEEADGNQDQAKAAGEQAKAAPKFLPPPVVVVGGVILNEGLPAEKAGLADGDRILAVNGRPANGILDLIREVVLAGPATATALVVERQGKRILLPVVLARNPQDATPPVDLLAELAKRKAEAQEEAKAAPGPEPQNAVLPGDGRQVAPPIPPPLPAAKPQK